MKEKYLLVLFYSLGGSVKNLAHAIADGAEREKIKVVIRTVPKVSPNNKQTESAQSEKDEIYCTKDELINSSAIAIGSPTRFGSMAAPLKYFLDSTGDIWSNNSLEDKYGLAFTSTSSMHGGQEITLHNIITYMLHQGMIILGSPYSIPNLSKTEGGGTPYGPTHVESINNSNKLSDDEYEIALKSGSRIAKLIKRFDQ